MISASEQDATEKLANTSSFMISSERNIDEGIILETRKNISKDLSANIIISSSINFDEQSIQ